MCFYHPSLVVCGAKIELEYQITHIIHITPPYRAPIPPHPVICLNVGVKWNFKWILLCPRETFRRPIGQRFFGGDIIELTWRIHYTPPFRQITGCGDIGALLGGVIHTLYCIWFSSSILAPSDVFLSPLHCCWCGYNRTRVSNWQ